jgi:uronate dehydrogenase
MNGTKPMHRILITGAAGGIGRTLRRGLAGAYPVLRLLDIAPLGAVGAGEEHVIADITDMAAMEDACREVDCLVHLAGVPVEQPWATVHPVNTVGCYTVFEAARRAGVRRFVFASSNHAVGFYRREKALDIDSLPRPDGYYGVTKVFGEALGRLYADKFGLEVACLRIGSFRERPEDRRQLSTWISPADMVRLVRCCIDAGDFHFVVAYGVSANTRSNWDNAGAAVIGYRPQDNAERFADEIMARKEADDPVAGRFHGGPYCAMDFAGNLDEID